MEIFFVFGIIFLFVFLNSLTYLAGALNTPLNYVFLGTVHWPGDYFYYLSQFAQGRENWFFSYDLYTSDFPKKVLVGWVNVFLGRIFSFLGINHLLAYQISVAFFAFSFLGFSYLLIKEIFKGKKEKGKRILAFVLFVTSNAFPKIIFEKGKLTFSYFDFWFNNGIAFNRLGGVPHHLIARTCISLVLLLALRWWRRQAGGIERIPRSRQAIKDLIFDLLPFGIVGFVLTSVEPVHWMMTIVILFLVPFFNFFIPPFAKEILNRLQNQIGKNKITIQKVILSETYLLLPSFFLFFGGLPMAFYLKKLFTVPPYSQLAVWEASQQLRISFFDFLLGNGPVAVLGLGGIIFGVKKTLFQFFSSKDDHLSIPRGRLKLSENIGYFFGGIFVFFTVFLYFSPFPSILKIVNVRFLPATTTIFLAIFATEFLFRLAEKLKKNLRQNIKVWKFCLIFLVVGVVMMTVPATFRQLQIRTSVDPKNSFFYVHQDVLTAYQEAEKISTVNETFLVIWPYNWSFPGITGRRVYEGHNLLTIDYEKKDKETAQFFFGKMKKKEREEFLRQKGIDYVLFYTHQEEIRNLSNLQKIYEKGTIGIYKVIK